MRSLLRRLGIKALAGWVAACALWSPLVAMPAMATPSQTCIYEGGSPTTPSTNVPSYIECDSSRNTFTNIAAPLDGSGNVKVDVAAGSITVTFPYAGTNGQTLTASSFVGVGALDANGKFSPLQEDASQNLLAKIVSGSTTAVTQATAANLNATVVFPSAQSVNATLQAGSANAGGVEIFDASGVNKLTVNSNGSINTSLYNAAGTAIATSASGTSIANAIGGTIGVQGITTGVPVQIAQGKTTTILTSASATSCTNIKASAGTLVEIVNVGSATTVFPAFFNDAATTCATGTRVYGNGSSLVLQAGQAIILNIPLSAGLAYTLSGALSDNLVVVTN